MSVEEIKNAHVYRMEVPPEARRFMILPAVRAKLLGKRVFVDGVEAPPNEFDSLQLCVLPVGWSWALWF